LPKSRLVLFQLTGTLENLNAGILLNANAIDQPRGLSSLLGAGSAKRNSVVAIDFGQRTTKAVHLQRKGETLELVQYVLQDAPSSDQTPSPELIGDHLKSLIEAIRYKGRKVTLVLGVGDALLRHAELPMVPVTDMRLMLKYNSKNYLQQDLPDYIFDCHTVAVAQNGAEPAGRSTKARVLVGGARKQTIEHMQQAAKHAGLVLEQITPGLACTANAFEFSMPEVFANEVVALVDLGFRSSTISILANGELSLSRVVSLGSDKLTAGLAEAMGVSYEEAEGIKVGLPEEVQGAMQGLITPLGRELRASIDFFEHQQDKTVSQVFVSGGSARSPFIVESLQSELMVQTRSWNPLSFMNMALPADKLGEVEQVASQLAVATGGAIAAL
jgi:type IV pilus assembly protein PilM